MEIVASPILINNLSYIDLKKILENRIQNLDAMERQYQAGENFELPCSTIVRWQNEIIELRSFIKKLEEELAK